MMRMRIKMNKTEEKMKQQEQAQKKRNAFGDRSHRLIATSPEDSGLPAARELNRPSALRGATKNALMHTTNH